MTNHSMLIVEDDPSIVKLIRAFYDMHPYDYDTASSAEEALSIVEKKEFDIFIIDINLGLGMHGVDLAVILRKKFPDSKIFAITGFTYLFDTISPEVAGFDACFSKPEGFADLAARIKEEFEK